LSECTNASNICTINKGQNHIDKGKYCIDNTFIYIGKDNSGGCNLAATITNEGYYFFKNNEIITNADTDPDSGYYCTSNSQCTEIEDSGIYINELSKKNVVSYLKKGTSQSVVISRKSSFLTGLNTPLLIECDLTNGCSTVNNGSANNVYINGFGNGLKNALIVCSSSTECSVTTPIENSYYISSTDSNGLIKCTKDGCTSLSYTSVDPNSYFLNSGINNDTKQLIYCDESKCEAIKKKNNFLINSADPTTLINCIKNEETLETTCSTIKGNRGVFYLNGGATNTFNDALIECNSESGCSYYTPEDGYYLNGNATSLSDALILCEYTLCKVEKAKNNLFYVNGARNDLVNGLIYCTNNDLCSTIKAKKDSYYLSGIVDGLTDALIYWDEDSVPTILNGIDKSYYLNTANTNSTDALINCNSEKCFTISETDDSYYISNTFEKGSSTIKTFKTLLYCNGKGTCDNYDAKTDSYYLNRASSDIDETLIYCELISSVKKCSYIPSNKMKPGYYLNAGDKYLTYPLITCDSKICTSLQIEKDVTPGFYINAGDSVNAIIICGNICQSTNSLELKKIGGYSYSDSVLKFYYNNTINAASTTSTTKDLFYNVKITEKDVFPSITSLVETVYKVSKYSITRYAIDGILSIGEDNTLATTDITLSNLSRVFSCSRKNMICKKITSCITNGFYLDITSGVGYYCDENKLTPVTNTGYYIDSSRYAGNNTPYLIHCNKESKCVNIDTPREYYLNAGINYMPKAKSSSSSTVKNDKNLIYCNGKNCNTLISITGYYLAGLSSADTEANRLIQCTDSICNPRLILTTSTFINNGIDNYLKPLIHCENDKCKTQEVTSGYFLSDTLDSLIYCEMNSCKVIKATSGYYYYGGSQMSNKYIIKCENQNSSDIECEKTEGEAGFYVSNNQNVLINCTEEQCKSFIAKNGIFRSATTTKISSTSKRRLSRFNRRATMIYNLIICGNDECHELSSSELAQIPICNYVDDKCYIDLPKSSSSTLDKVTSISAGGFCTNSDHSKIYFATGSIIVESNEVDSSFSITSKTKNCLEVSKKYKNNYYIYGDIIYKLNENSITEVNEPGYYFIDSNTNTLATYDDIDSYNVESVKLYKCNEDGCSVVSRPDTITYYTDVNKNIIMYDVTRDRYAFMNNIICIYSNGKCTPNSNMNNQNVCITYKGEIVLTSAEIQSHETDTCYKSNDINTNIYGYNQNLYLMDSNSVQLIQNTSYFFINSISHTMANYKDFINGKNYSVLVYGCLLSNCHLYEPEEGLYYYNTVGKYLIKYENGVWTTPKTSGYALVSINPNEVYIYKFSIVSGNTILENKASEGFYYTIDEEMYVCTNQSHVCEKISESGYYFTASDEMYYCLYDSEHIEKTTCYKQTCTAGQYYFIEDRYHRCEKNSILHPVSQKYCSNFEKVIINFPTMYKNEMPTQVKKAIDNIEIHNNSTSVVKSNNINTMNIVPGIFTNCTYNNEDDTTNFDLICISNYVLVDEDKDAKICSIEKLGYIECEADPENPGKCHASFALHSFYSSMIMHTVIIFFIIYLLIN